ncbi:hypothetical protein LENED_004718 [Lentinula edodes]|uniref:Uncharacterized protein n=1 Tax=Lentinula edodes TaxID=5353 RepID=A0A1Q3E772_LENED|nr:hypothetical protein LENED_004718 [Lentinula edodes]
MIEVSMKRTNSVFETPVRIDRGCERCYQRYDSATSLATQFRDTLQLVVDNESQEGRPLVSTDSTCISVITVRDVTYYAALDTQA